MSLWLIIFFVIILLSVEILGAFSVFSKHGLLFFTLVNLIVVVFCVRKNLQRIGCFAGAKRYFIGKPAGLPAFVFFLIVFVPIIFEAELTPIAEIDSIAYHLPIVSNLVNTKGIWDVFNAGYVGPNTFFPANHEALQAFFAVLGGNMNFGYVVTLLSFMLLSFALYELGNVGKRKMPMSFIVVVALSCASAPFLFNQFLNLQIDLFMFCLFGSAIALLVSSLLNNDKLDLAKGFLVLGIMLGAKYNAVPQIAVALPFFIFLFFHHRKSIKTIWWFPFLILVPGICWYVRNWIIAGNPIYPFGLYFWIINFEGHKTFINDTIETSLLSFIGKDGFVGVLSHVLRHGEFATQLGRLSLVLFPTAFLSVVTAMIFERRKNIGGVLVFIFLFYLFFAETFYYLSSPYTYILWHQTIRYAAPIFALLPVFFILSAGRSRVIYLMVFCLTGGILIYNIVFKSFLFDADNVALVGQKSGIIASTIGDVELDDRFLSKKLNIYSSIFPHIEKLREIKNIEKQKIALAGLTPYWLFEKEGFEPIYVNIDGCTECKYFDYRNEEKSIRAYPDAQKWKEALRTLNVKYLIVDFASYSSEKELEEETWAKNDTEMFTLILRTKSVGLYGIN